MDKIKSLQIQNLNKCSLKNYNLRIVCIIIIAITVYTLPLLLRVDKAMKMPQKNFINSWYDVYYFCFSYYFSILENHQFSLWNHFMEGGGYLFSYPIQFSLEPLTFILILFGIVKGLNLSWYFSYILGALSMCYFTKSVLKYNILGSVYSSLIFAMCGFFAYMQSNAFFTARATLFIPLLATFFLKALHDNKYIIWTSGLLSFFFIQTALYFPVIVLFLFIIASSNLIKKKQNKFFVTKRPLIVFLAVILLTFLFSMYYLLPLLETLKIDSRISGQVYRKAVTNANTISLFVERLLIPKNSGAGTMYIGYIPVLFCLFSAILFFKEMKKWLIILFLFIILSFGSNSFLDLHYFLWHLPIFKSIIEIAKYYTPIIIFLISLISGKIFLLFDKKKLKKSAKYLGIIVIFATYFNLLYYNIGYFNIYETELPIQKKHGIFFNIKAINIHKGDEGALAVLWFALYLRGYGLLNRQYQSFTCMIKDFIEPKYFVIPHFAFLMPSTRLITMSNLEYKGEAYFENKNNVVKNIFLKTNTIDIRVEITEPGRLIINQSYSKYWKMDNHTIENNNGRLSVFLDKLGSYEIKLIFFPLNFYFGLFISMTTIMLCFFLLFKNRQRCCFNNSKGVK